MSYFESFRHCMKNSYNIDIPDSVEAAFAAAFAGLGGAAATFKLIAATVEKFGAETTIAELVGAGLASEIAEVVVAVVAALGAGAAVGAFLACGVIDELL